MTFSLAQNAIALLIDLAERREIDPWDVKVIEVIDRFLSQLSPLPMPDVNSPGDGRAPYETDLSQSGQAFLYASMLVLLKADSLARIESSDVEEALVEEELLEGVDYASPLPQKLEQRIRRRAVALPPQNRRVTLQELIAQLEIMAATVADHKPRIRARRPRPQSRTQAIRAIAQLAHQENLSEMAAALEQFLADHWLDASKAEEWMDFEALLELWMNSEAQEAIAKQSSAHHSEQSNRVGVFWALLFLSAQSKVELAQEEFYGDLKVRSFSPVPPDPMAQIVATL